MSSTVAKSLFLNAVIIFSKKVIHYFEMHLRQNLAKQSHILVDADQVKIVC